MSFIQILISLLLTLLPVVGCILAGISLVIYKKPIHKIIAIITLILYVVYSFHDLTNFFNLFYWIGSF